MNITKKRQLVLDAIKNVPEAANDDALLIAIIWEMEGWNYSQSILTNLRKVTRPATIVRRRAELHEAGLIQYSDKTDAQRMEAFVNERDAHSTFLPEPLRQLH